MISAEARAMILDSTRVGVPLDGRNGSARAAGTTAEAVRASMREDSEEARAFAREMAAAASEGARAMVRPPEPAPVLALPPSGVDAGRWAKVHVEAAQLAPGPFGYYLWLDARCVAAGMPASSGWWRYSVGGFYASGKMLGIFGPGRGSGKSTTLERFTAERSLFAPRIIPPGQTWTWPFISVGPDDANRRINGIAAVYRAAGLTIIGEEDAEGGKHKEGVKIARAPRGSLELLDARGNAIQLASIAGTIGNVSGPSTIGMTIDEAAKLHDKATNANPLTEIIASGAQTSRARAGWQALISSSAMWASGAFFELIEQGDNEMNFIARIGPAFIDDALRGFEMVATWEERGDVGRAPDPIAAGLIRAHARTLTASSWMVPTWVANPTLGNPEAKAWDGAALASRKLAQALPEGALGGIPRVLFWLRENGSLPMASGAGRGSSAWTTEDWAAHREEMRGLGPAPRLGETDFARLSMLDGTIVEDATPQRYRGL